MAVLHHLARRLEQLDALDPVAAPLARAVGRVVRPRPLRNLLSGTNLGHPLHPVLTDVPIGAWGMSVLLDNVGGKLAEPAADVLLAAGVAAAVPTAATGWNDWSDTYGPARRVGLVHAGVNVTALSLYVASLIARRSGQRRRGKGLSLVALGVLMAGGYLGGHLTFVKAVNVNHTAFEDRPREWTPVLPDSELAEGAHRKVLAGDAPVLLCREAGEVLALASTCSHMGGPLEEGRIADGCVTCPWHGSTFNLADGGIVRGPASTPQPSYDTRVNDGHIEVRARH
ncbi:Rieske 2Fe-2S domain-containing protein [Streptomyces sp. NPDC002870]|uniref:Rieske 2Fe-2S domain-containing protein n=1 Tax=Streptomyces sp. NPDC002870 TaxID=3364666 RepID=UPI0036CCD149